MFRGSVTPTRISVAAVNTTLEFQERTQQEVQGQETPESNNISRFQSSYDQNGTQAVLPQTDEKVKAQELAPNKPSTRSKDYCLLLSLVIVLLFFCVANLIFTLHLRATCGCRDSSSTEGKILLLATFFLEWIEFFLKCA